MSRYIIIRESGSSELLLIDKQTQRNMILPADALVSGTSALDGAVDGAFAGVDLAVAINDHPDVVSRMFYSEAA